MQRNLTLLVLHGQLLGILHTVLLADVHTHMGLDLRGTGNGLQVVLATLLLLCKEHTILLPYIHIVYLDQSAQYLFHITSLLVRHSLSC